MSYEDNIKKWKKAYEEIFEMTSKYDDFYNLYGFRDLDDVRKSAKDHLLLIEWYEKYGLKISHDHKPNSYNFIKLGDNTSFNHYSDAKADKERGGGKYIAWPVDGRQPKNEWLFILSFSTGAYIFGRDYEDQQEIYKKFIEEIKKYKPDYSDNMNSSYYWKLKNAKDIFDNYTEIFNKYKDLNKQEFSKREANRLRKRLAELENNA